MARQTFFSVPAYKSRQFLQPCFESVLCLLQKAIALIIHEKAFGSTAFQLEIYGAALKPSSAINLDELQH